MLALMRTSFLLLGLCATARSGEPVLLVQETLALPTASGVSLLLVPAEDVELMVDYGVAGAGRPTRLGPLAVSAGETARFLLDGQRPSSEVDYRVLVRATTPGATWHARPTRSFRTLRAPGDPIAFAFGPDSHLYEIWSRAVFDDKPMPLALFKATLDNMALDDALDFLVLGGDHAITHCNLCPGGSWEGEQYVAASATSQKQAWLRYVKLLEPQHLGRVTGQLPFVWVLGNHEGETAPTASGCLHSTQLSTISQSARQALLPAPRRAYGNGNEEGSYYAFESGDALVVVLDVMRFSPSLPQVAGDWTLGDEQLTWLARTLRGSTARWRFLAAEHLVGGVNIGLLQCYHYGRGGLLATQDSSLGGDFLGEQALLQELMELTTPRGGASFFLTGHDHVAMPPTEKLDSSGLGTRVFYLKGGSIGSGPGVWKDDAKFQKQMDWNGDGEADYWNDIDGSIRRGYWRFHVLGRDAVQCDYVVTDLDDPLLNGSVLLSRSVQAGPP